MKFSWLDEARSKGCGPLSTLGDRKPTRTPSGFYWSTSSPPWRCENWLPHQIWYRLRGFFHEAGPYRYFRTEEEAMSALLAADAEEEAELDAKADAGREG